LKSLQIIIDNHPEVAKYAHETQVLRAEIDKLCKRIQEFESGQLFSKLSEAEDYSKSLAIQILQVNEKNEQLREEIYEKSSQLSEAGQENDKIATLRVICFPSLFFVFVVVFLLFTFYFYFYFLLFIFYFLFLFLFLFLLKFNFIIIFNGQLQKKTRKPCRNGEENMRTKVKKMEIYLRFSSYY
jgi:hypothetical protein